MLESARSGIILRQFVGCSCWNQPGVESYSGNLQCADTGISMQATQDALAPSASQAPPFSPYMDMVHSTLHMQHCCRGSTTQIRSTESVRMVAYAAFKAACSGQEQETAMCQGSTLHHVALKVHKLLQWGRDRAGAGDRTYMMQADQQRPCHTIPTSKKLQKP